MALEALIPLLVAMMLLTGCCNTLLTKYQVYISFHGLLMKTNHDAGQSVCAKLR